MRIVNKNGQFVYIFTHCEVITQTEKLSKSMSNGNGISSESLLLDAIIS